MTVDSDRVSARLPAGYRARQFADRDREPLLAELLSRS